MQEEKKVVAIYTRVSTNDQVREGHSLEEQERRLRALCETYDYDIYKVYTDAGISGKSTDNRPQYQQMLKDMRKGKFNVVMAFKLDRISRSIVDFENFFNELKQYNCGIELLCEKIDTSMAAGMMFARILGAFAQFEREMIQERTLIGVESAVKKGHFGGKPPLGYRHKTDFKSMERIKEWEIFEDEAKIVREIFELCSMGKTYFQISQILKSKYPFVVSKYVMDNETNEKIPIYRTWSDGSISRIINNKSYIGIYEYRKTVSNKETKIVTDKIPAIIDEELFYDCQDIIARNSRNYYRSKNYLFMQKIKCPKCGRFMKCNGTKKPNGTEYLYYKCKDCGIYVREELVEKVLVNELDKLFEICNILNYSHMMVETYVADWFNKNTSNHQIRFALDSRIIDDKCTLPYDFDLNGLWNAFSYESKCRFIQMYVDYVTLTDYKVKGKRVDKAKNIELHLKSYRLNKLLDLKSNNLLDEIMGNGIMKMSVANMKSEKQAYDYIDILKKKYKFSFIELDDENGWELSPKLFKIINIKPSSVVAKKKTLALFLEEEQLYVDLL